MRSNQLSYSPKIFHFACDVVYHRQPAVQIGTGCYRKSQPLMLRQNRWSIRISFLLVILAAAFGIWYATTFWQPSLTLGDWSAYSEGVDWVETISGWGETAIQILLGATSTR